MLHYACDCALTPSCAAAYPNIVFYSQEFLFGVDFRFTNAAVTKLRSSEPLKGITSLAVYLWLMAHPVHTSNVLSFLWSNLDYVNHIAVVCLWRGVMQFRIF